MEHVIWKAQSWLVVVLLGSLLSLGCSGGENVATNNALGPKKGNSLDSITLGVDATPSVPSAVITAAPVDFGLTDCGTASSPETITVQNTGTGTLAVGA